MTKIAIVDDNKEQASAIELAIAEYGKIAGLSFVVDYYPSAYALDTRDSEYDLLFLDIQMPGKDGMSYAREIRARNPDVLICFTTSFAQYALKGYEVNAVDYILKPIATAEFITKFPRMLRFISKNPGKSIMVRTKDGVRKLAFSDIVYVETLGHYLTFHLVGGEALESRGLLKDIENELTLEDGFARCHSSFLVNLKQVKTIKGNDVEMLDGSILAISPGKRKQFLMGLSKF